MVVLDYRTAIGALEDTVAAIKDRMTRTPSSWSTPGVPRYLIQDQVEAAGGVYSPKNEPEHLTALVGTLKPASAAAASRDS